MYLKYILVYLFYTRDNMRLGEQTRIAAEKDNCLKFLGWCVNLKEQCSLKEFVGKYLLSLISCKETC